MAESKYTLPVLGDVLDTRWTDEQRALQAVARSYAENELAPRIREIVETEGFMPRDLYKRMGELGFIGLLCDKENGGSGLGITEMTIVMEEISKVSPSVAIILASIAPGLIPLQKVPEFKDRYLADIISGDKVFDGAVTDPAGHTNINEWPVMATKVDGGYLVSGTKLFTTSAAGVDIHEVYCLDENREMKIFIIEDGTPGFSHDVPEKKFGMLGTGGGTVTYQDVFVPDSLLIPTEVGGGDYYNVLWLGASTMALGAMEGLLARATDYVKKRTFNHKPLAAMQAQAERIALLYAKMLTCRSLIYDAASDYDAGEISEAAAAIKCQVSKSLIPTVAFEVTRECVKLFGGKGYSDVEYYHLFTDAVGTAIADQTTEYVLEVLAHSLEFPEELY